MNTILIIEDEERVAGLLKAGLEENGYQTWVAYDGSMGLRLFKQHTFNWLSQMSSSLKWTDLNYARRSGRSILPYPS